MACADLSFPDWIVTARPAWRTTISRRRWSLRLPFVYRAIAWPGEEMEEKAEGVFAPRCVKDVIVT
jgi:hypothetical protein